MSVTLIFSNASCFLLLTIPVFGEGAGLNLTSSSITVNAEMEKTVFLEKVKAEIDFCIRHFGKSFNEVDVKKIDGLQQSRRVITNGLIAEKYEYYSDLFKAAEYYYKDYLSEKLFLSGKYWGSKHAWGGEGDYTPFPAFMYTLKENKEYQKMLKVYPEYFDYYFLSQYAEGTKEEKMQSLKDEIKNDPEVAKQYEDFMKEWGKIKKLARTVKPKPLEPAVQNHEWFYSEKQSEVLKSLTYYHKYKVKFMLEKALNHNHPVVAKKAKEYIDRLKESEKHEKNDK